MNRSRTYGYAVFKSPYVRMPFHIVEIHHELLVAFSVFSRAEDAKQYILYEKDKLEGLKYNPDFEFCEPLLQCYLQEDSGFFSKVDNRQMYIC